MREENLCTGCGCDNFVAECENCPIRVKAQQESTEVTEAPMADEVTASQRDHDRQRRDRSAKKQCHQTLTINIDFPDEFRAEIKGNKTNDLIKTLESWKEKRYVGKDLVAACDTAIADLKIARQFGGFPKAIWWKSKGKLRIKLEFSNHRSMELFKGKIAA